jgi:hypothetical protein
MSVAEPNRAVRDTDWLAVATELTQHLAQQDREAISGGAAANFYQRN